MAGVTDTTATRIQAGGTADVGDTVNAITATVFPPEGDGHQLSFGGLKATGSAYGVVQNFGQNGLRFPKRAYGGACDGKLILSRASTHGRGQKGPLQRPFHLVWGGLHINKKEEIG